MGCGRFRRTTRSSVTSQLVRVSVRVTVIWLFTEVCYVCVCCIAAYSISETKDSILTTSASGIICDLVRCLLTTVSNVSAVKVGIMPCAGHNLTFLSWGPLLLLLV